MLRGWDLGDVLLAALGDEVGLRDHRDPQLREVGQVVVGHYGSMLDAIQRMTTRGTQGRDGHHQLGRGDAVHRNRPSGAVLVGNPVRQGVQVEPIVAQDFLTR